MDNINNESEKTQVSSLHNPIQIGNCFKVIDTDRWVVITAICIESKKIILYSLDTAQLWEIDLKKNLTWTYLDKTSVKSFLIIAQNYFTNEKFYKSKNVSFNELFSLTI